MNNFRKFPLNLATHCAIAVLSLLSLLLALLSVSRSVYIYFWCSGAASCECTYEITHYDILCVRLVFGFEFQKDVRNGIDNVQRKIYPKKIGRCTKREENGKETPTHTHTKSTHMHCLICLSLDFSGFAFFLFSFLFVFVSWQRRTTSSSSLHNACTWHTRNRDKIDSFVTRNQRRFCFCFYSFVRWARAQYIKCSNKQQQESLLLLLFVHLVRHSKWIESSTLENLNPPSKWNTQRERARRVHTFQKYRIIWNDVESFDHTIYEIYLKIEMSSMPKNIMYAMVHR